MWGPVVPAIWMNKYNFDFIASLNNILATPVTKKLLDNKTDKKLKLCFLVPIWRFIFLYRYQLLKREGKSKIILY